VNAQPSTNKQALIARTPLDQWHAQHGARFAEGDGWRLPAAYQGVQEEIAVAKSGVGLADISAFAKVRLVGAAVPTAVARFTDNAASKPGKVFTVRANERLIGCWLTADQLLLLGSTPRLSNSQSLVSVGQDLSLEQQDVTCGVAGVHLIGPRTDELLRRLMSLDMSELAFPAGSCAETSCAGIHATVVRYAECVVPGVRVYVSWDLGEYLWERLLEAGRSLGIAPLGIDAWRLLVNLDSRDTSPL
jgi:glycine cleavage system T protein (aminomethyltransferase)